MILCYVRAELEQVVYRNGLPFPAYDEKDAIRQIKAATKGLEDFDSVKHCELCKLGIYQNGETAFVSDFSVIGNVGELLAGDQKEDPADE